MSGDIWTTLGILATDDASAIRKAYSRKLKATDVEGNPEAFVTLHAAYKDALAKIGSPAGPAPPPDRQTERTDQPGMPGSADARSQAPFLEDRAHDLASPPFRHLQALLFDETGAPHAEALQEAVAEILALSAMEFVDYAARVEDWLAQAAYRAIPRSDPIAPLLVDHFNWKERQGRIDQPPILDALIVRARGQDLIDMVADADHPMYEAYCSLAGWGPEVDSRQKRQIGGEVRQLLKVIRERAPAAESFLNRDRVTQWDRRLGTTPRTDWHGVERVVEPDRTMNKGTDPGKMILGVLLLVMLARIASCIAQPPY